MVIFHIFTIPVVNKKKIFLWINFYLFLSLLKDNKENQLTNKSSYFFFNQIINAESLYKSLQIFLFYLKKVRVTERCSFRKNEFQKIIP